MFPLVSSSLPRAEGSHSFPFSAPPNLMEGWTSAAFHHLLSRLCNLRVPFRPPQCSSFFFFPVLTHPIDQPPPAVFKVIWLWFPAPHPLVWWCVFHNPSIAYGNQYGPHTLTPRLHYLLFLTTAFHHLPLVSPQTPPSWALSMVPHPPPQRVPNVLQRTSSTCNSHLMDVLDYDRGTDEKLLDRDVIELMMVEPFPSRPALRPLSGFYPSPCLLWTLPSCM